MKVEASAGNAFIFREECLTYNREKGDWQTSPLTGMSSTSMIRQRAGRGNSRMRNIGKGRIEKKKIYLSDYLLRIMWTME